MNVAQLIPVLLATGAVLVVLTTYPYLATAIAYRDRDNGLSYIVFLMGVAVWNGLFAAQVIDPRPIVKGFFFSIATLGAILAGVGWLLFASTASSTPLLPYQGAVYRFVALLAGLEIALAITNGTRTVLGDRRQFARYPGVYRHRTERRLLAAYGVPRRAVRSGDDSLRPRVATRDRRPVHAQLRHGRGRDDRGDRR